MKIENALLGLCMNYPEFVKMVKGLIPLEYFEISAPWKFMYQEVDQGRQPTLSMVIKETKMDVHLNQCADLYDTPSSFQSLIHGMIEEHRDKKAHDLIRTHVEEKTSIDDLIISLKEVQSIGLVKESNWIDELQAATDSILTPDSFGVGGSVFGIPALDQNLHGAEPGDLIIIAARPSMGKSVLVTTVVKQLSFLGDKRGLIWTLEMTKTQIIERQLASFGVHTFNQIRTKNVREDNLLDDVARLAEKEIKIIDKTGVNVHQMCGEIIRQHAIKPLDYVMIDHGGWIRLTAGKQNTSEKKGEISKRLKGLAKELGIPIFLLWQLSRGVESRGGMKKPMLSDLRDSGELEEDADKVLMLWRPDYYDIDTDENGDLYPENYGEIDVAKSRGGKVGVVPATFDMRKVLWRPILDPVFIPNKAKRETPFEV